MDKNSAIGEKYGRLTILEGSKRVKGRLKRKCLCDCGKITFVCLSDLRNGNTSSCGCFKKELISKRLSKNLEGQRFGKLLAIERVPNIGKQHRVYYKCKCDCGNEVLVRGTALTTGNTNSCGCYAKLKNKQRGLLSRGQNKYIINGDIAYVKLDNSNEVAIIDTEDISKINKYKWFLTPDGYIQANDLDNKKTLKLHRLVVENNSQKPTDHINRNKLDNRKTNLRICDTIDNANNLKLSILNTTGHKNIVRATNNKYAATFVYYGKTYRCGTYNSINEAVAARNAQYEKLGIKIED